MPSEPPSSSSLASVAVCNTGLMRSLLAPVVVDSFTEHLVSPLETAGFVVDTYLQVVGVGWPAEGSHESTFIQTAMTNAYRRSTVSLLPVLLPKFRCPPNRRVKGQGFLLGTSDVLVQFMAITSCFERIQQEETRRQTRRSLRVPDRYTYLMRVRTDLVYLSDIPTWIFHDTSHVYVVASGMAPRLLAGSTCMNDHIFVCPRALCRSYFHMLEIFQSEHCRRIKGGNENISSIFATRTANGELLPNSWSNAPSSAFLVPDAPSTWFTAQWYIFARHTDAGRVCGAREPPQTCCGLIKEFSWWYSLATVDEHETRPSVGLDCTRMQWSHRGRLDDPGLRAGIAECNVRNASQHAAEAAPGWRSSSFMTTFRTDCARKWSCSRADSQGVSHNQTLLVESAEDGGTSGVYEQAAAPASRAISHRPGASLPHAEGTAGRQLQDSQLQNSSFIESPICPANGDLANASAFDAMLHARASPDRDIALMLFGKVGPTNLTTGVVPIEMGWEGVQYVESLATRLSALGIHNHLVVTAATTVGAHMDGVVCHETLRPLGLCCGWSSAGHEELRHNEWGWHDTHPHFLKLQLWWVVAQVLARGYNAMTLDFDIHLARNPFEILKSPSFSDLGVVFAADSNWPEQQVQGGSQRGATVVCRQNGLSRPRTGKADQHSCACGLTPSPMINTAFSYARTSPASAALFDSVASTIIKRLGQPPANEEQQVRNAVMMWEQDVLNEMVYKMARLPRDLSLPIRARCHTLDQECVPATRAPQNARKPTPNGNSRWWIDGTHRTHGAWLADVQRRPPPAEGCDWENRELMARTELVTASGHTTRLGLLPRSVFGRLCGRRRIPLTFYESHINFTDALPCSFYSAVRGSRSFMGQAILHAQSKR